MDAGGGSANPCRLIAILPLEIGADPRQQFVDPALLAAPAGAGGAGNLKLKLGGLNEIAEKS